MMWVIVTRAPFVKQVIMPFSLHNVILLRGYFADSLDSFRIFSWRTKWKMFGNNLAMERKLGWRLDEPPVCHALPIHNHADKTTKLPICVKLFLVGDLLTWTSCEPLGWKGSSQHYLCLSFTQELSEEGEFSTWLLHGMIPCMFPL